VSPGSGPFSCFTRCRPVPIAVQIPLFWCVEQCGASTLVATTATCSGMSIPSQERVTRRRAKLRAMGLRPVQIWLPDTRAPGFAAECRRQCLLLTSAEDSSDGRAETTFWEQASADAWDDLG
jgi:hypothetical protein